MNNIQTTVIHRFGAPRGPFHLRSAFTFLALMIGGAVLQAQQSATIDTRTKNYWAGARPATNAVQAVVGTHFIGVTGGNTNISLALSTNNPALGLESSNLTAVTFTPGATASNANFTLRFSTRGPLVPGVYPLLINAFTNDGVSTTNLITSTADLNLIVGRQWTNTAVNAIGNWSDASKWGDGITPGPTDSVYMESPAATTWTNVVDTSVSIQDLVYLRGDANLTNVTRIEPGVTLSVLGSRGFITGSKQVNARTTTTRFDGDTLVVSNQTAIFSVTEAMGNNTTAGSVIMSGLNNLRVTVSRVGIYDASMLANSTVGVQLRNGFMFAKTNIIKALHTEDYTAHDFNTAIQISRNIAAGNAAGFGSTYAGLGASNVFFADSIGVGRGGAIGTGVGMGNTFGYPLRFQTQNSTAPTNVAYFRNSDGVSRMSLVAVGVDSGTNSVNNNAGIIDLRGGKVDMLADQIWVGRLRSNNGGSSYYCAGGFYFENGVVDANLVRVGYGQYTNVLDPTPARAMMGYVLVGTNGTLVVNDELNLGYTPADSTGFEGYVALYGGQLRVDNGGRIHANRITVGERGTNSLITLNSGSTLVVSNTIASATAMLPRLTASSATLTLNPMGSPLVYVSNLIATAATPINIGSLSGLSGFPGSHTTTNIPLIVYDTAVSPNFWVGGTGPGISVAVFNDAPNKTIRAVLSAGTPKTLVWKDYTGNHTWNYTSKNWLDVNTGLATNYSALDKVTFDDTGFPNVAVADTIVASQTAGGTVVSNNSVNYVFTSSGGGFFTGGAPVTKQGNKDLKIDLATEFTVTVSEGSLTNTASGVLGGVNVSAGAAFANFGNMISALSCAGVAVNEGTITTGVTVQNGGVVTNTSGIINGAVTVSSTNSVLVNNSTITGTTVTINSGAILVNNSTINSTGGITVNSGGTLIDSVSAAISNAQGSINVGASQLVVRSGGTFIPGGNSITYTKVAEYPQFTARPAGGVNLEAGSITVFNVNFANPITNNTVLLNQAQFGPSPGSTGLPRAFNGCTLVINNVGATPFAPGQVFNLFQYYQGGDIICPVGTVTNSFPVIQPASPGPGLRWSLSELYYKGNLKVVAENDPAYNIYLTNSVTTLNGTNFISLNWPEANKGGWLQSLTTGLTNGLSATNWTYVPNSSISITANLTNLASPGCVFYRFVYP